MTKLYTTDTYSFFQPHFPGKHIVKSIPIENSFGELLLTDMFCKHLAEEGKKQPLIEVESRF